MYLPVYKAALAGQHTGVVTKAGFTVTPSVFVKMIFKLYKQTNCEFFVVLKKKKKKNATVGVFRYHQL
jgi:hypothetical protein